MAVVSSLKPRSVGLGRSRLQRCEPVFKPDLHGAMFPAITLLRRQAPQLLQRYFLQHGRLRLCQTESDIVSTTLFESVRTLR